MGITVNSIHINSKDAVSFPNVKTASFSENWHTVIAAEEEISPSLAKALSKEVSSPVLFFSAFDSDGLLLWFFVSGKKVAAYSDLYGQSSGIFKIPALVGYGNGEKRRISVILGCADFERKLAMLEEFFGVCLTPFPDEIEEDAAALKRTRGDTNYLAYAEEEKKLRGKNAPIKATLVSETVGKLFVKHFGDERQIGDPLSYYFGYDTKESEKSGGALRAVRFTDGALITVPEEGLTFSALNDKAEDERFRTVERYPKYTILCTEKAPEAYQGKTLVIPDGFEPLGFDGKGRLFLGSSYGSVAVTDAENKIVSRISVKGEPCAINGAFLLTAGTESFFAYEYSPDQHIRIYRIDDK